MDGIQGKVIIITGASDGIGAAAARELSKQGAKIVITGRSELKTKAIAKELACDYFIADFSKLKEVQELGITLRTTYSRIDVLINNAGGIFGSRKVTVDGHEMTFQVNHLAHFLLTNLLIDRLIDNRATVINTSSVAHRLFSKFDINDLDMERQYTTNSAYGNAKLENILFTKELHKRFNHKGINTVAFHPGNVTTNFAHGSKSILRLLYRTPLKYLARLISPEQGADTLVWLASSIPNKDWKPGNYYYKRKIHEITKEAQDPELARLLWEKSAAMTNEFTIS